MSDWAEKLVCDAVCKVHPEFCGGPPYDEIIESIRRGCVPVSALKPLVEDCEDAADVYWGVAGLIAEAGEKTDE